MKWSRELRIARRSMRTAIRRLRPWPRPRRSCPASLRRRRGPTPHRPGHGSRQFEVGDFGSNPGRLSMLVHLPTDPPSAGRAAGRAAAWLRPVGRGVRPRHGLGRPGRPARRCRCVLPGAVGREQSRPLLQLVPSRPHRPRTRRSLVDPPDGRDGGRAVRFRPWPGLHRRPVRRRRDDRCHAGGLPGRIRRRRRRRRSAGRGGNRRDRGAARGWPRLVPHRSRADWAEQVRHAAPAGFRDPGHGCPSGTAMRIASSIPPTRVCSRNNGRRCMASIGSRSVPGRSGARHELGMGQRLHAVERWMLPDQPHTWPVNAADEVARFWRLI